MINAGPSRLFRRACGGVQLGLAVVAIGCSGGNRGGGGATFCQDYVNAAVAKATACQGGSTAAYDTLFQTLNLCDGVSADLAAGKLSFSPPAAQACLAELTNADCGAAGSLLPDCAKVYTGDVPAGSSCFPLMFGIASESRDLPALRDARRELWNQRRRSMCTASELQFGRWKPTDLYDAVGRRRLVLFGLRRLRISQRRSHLRRAEWSLGWRPTVRHDR
jgi:hypothetical protein